MTDQPEPLSAYDLLSKPTISLTDAEVKLIVEDLRTRRESYVKTGAVDRPDKPKPAKATTAQKEKNTAALLAKLKI